MNKQKQLIFSCLKSSFFAHPELLSELSQLKKAKIFITGGTGFFGCWILESLAWLSEEHGIEIEITLLTRNFNSFKNKYPRLSGLSFVEFLEGDIRNFEFPKGPFSHVIHAATEASVKLNLENPLLMFDTIIQGTRRALDFAVQAGVSKFLLTSSGAIYGPQPKEQGHISEDDRGGPNPLDQGSAYGEGKRAAEYLCAAYAQYFGLESTIARCFAFVGPYLPLDTHFAIGNFIRDAVQGKAIQINGDGTPLRSYMYGSDLVVWLWTLLLRGDSGRAYNVGSEKELTIFELAQNVVQSVSPGLPLSVAKKAVPNCLPERYVPSTQRAQRELQLKETFSLHDSISKTVEWHRFGSES